MTKIDNPSHWKPGQTGNPLGRPKGTRNQFSAAFIGDMQASWAQHGANVLDVVARKDPSRYLGIASSLIPKDVALSIEARQVGGLSPQDLEIFRAIKQALPDAGAREPGEVLNYVLEAIRAHSAPTIEGHTENPLKTTDEKPA